MGETAPQGSGQPASNAAGVEEFFARVATLGPQPRLRSVSGTCVFDIAGAGTWRVTIRDGVPTITKDGSETASADCVIASTADDFMRVVRREGDINIFAAFLQNLVTITGDVGFATTVLGSALPDTVGVVGTQSR